MSANAIGRLSGDYVWPVSGSPRAGSTVIAVVTMSEFGRTAKENGDRGTDHGHANCMFVMGGDIKGGKVYGKWPGLQSHQLYEGRDLFLTTDFRDVLGERQSVIARRLPGLPSKIPWAGVDSLNAH
jgi:uncharacterized protein (DUF1501 family)